MQRGLGAEGKFPGDGLEEEEEEQSPEPPAHTALVGHPGFPQLTTAFPASHPCQGKAELFGAAHGTWSSPGMGTVGHRGS